INDKAIKQSTALETTDTVYYDTNAKYNAQVYGIYTNVNYIYHINSISSTLAPSAGFKYSYFEEDGYKEESSGLRYLKKKGADKSMISAGLRITKDDIVLGAVQLIPEVYGSIDYTLRQTSPEIQALLGERITLTRSDLRLGFLNKNTEYNLGVGIKSQSDRLDIKAVYEATFVSNFIQHMGSLKLRVNF
ncbi:autotransporter domain-containing protein, partial [Rickettsiaceae bacterium]|nr:autotransporter domain-containing protein [Rickettsiaceae bacterium]